MVVVTLILKDLDAAYYANTPTTNPNLTPHSSQKSPNTTPEAIRESWLESPGSCTLGNILQSCRGSSLLRAVKTSSLRRLRSNTRPSAPWKPGRGSILEEAHQLKKEGSVPTQNPSEYQAILPRLLVWQKASGICAEPADVETTVVRDTRQGDPFFLLKRCCARMRV